MGKTRWMTGSLVGLALLVGSIGPAQARPRYDRNWGHHHHRDRGNGFGFGDAVGVAALIGAVAIVASSMSKDKKAARNSDAAAPRRSMARIMARMSGATMISPMSLPPIAIRTR